MVGGAVNAAMGTLLKARLRPRKCDDININHRSGQTQTDRVEQLFAQFAEASNKSVEQAARWKR